MHPFSNVIFALATHWPNSNAYSSVLEQRVVQKRRTQVHERQSQPGGFTPLLNNEGSRIGS